MQEHVFFTQMTGLNGTLYGLDEDGIIFRYVSTGNAEIETGYWVPIPSEVRR